MAAQSSVTKGSCCHQTVVYNHFTTLRNEVSSGFWLHLRNSQHASGYRIDRLPTSRRTNDRRHQANGSTTWQDILWHFIVRQFRFHAQFIIISYHFAAFLFMVMSLTHLNRMCFYCFISSIFDPMTWWNYARVWANNEWVNERRKEAANYIDKHQLCSKAITWLWKIELIDAAQHRHRVCSSIHVSVMFGSLWTVRLHTYGIIKIGSDCCLVRMKATECSVFGRFCIATLYQGDRPGTTSATPWQHSALCDGEMDGWMHSGVERRGVDIYLDIWFIYWRSMPRSFSFIFRFPIQPMPICTNILLGSGTFSLVKLISLFFF